MLWTKPDTFAMCTMYEAAKMRSGRKNVILIIASSISQRLITAKMEVLWSNWKPISNK